MYNSNTGQLAKAAILNCKAQSVIPWNAPAKWNSLVAVCVCVILFNFILCLVFVLMMYCTVMYYPMLYTRNAKFVTTYFSLL